MSTNIPLSCPSATAHRTTQLCCRNDPTNGTHCKCWAPEQPLCPLYDRPVQEVIHGQQHSHTHIYKHTSLPHKLHLHKYFLTFQVRSKEFDKVSRGAGAKKSRVTLRTLQISQQDRKDELNVRLSLLMPPVAIATPPLRTSPLERVKTNACHYGVRAGVLYVRGALSGLV